jgi:hypothetical protein
MLKVHQGGSHERRSYACGRPHRSVAQGAEIWMRPKVSLSMMEAVIGDWLRCWQQAFDTWTRSVKKTMSAETRRFRSDATKLAIPSHSADHFGHARPCWLKVGVEEVSPPGTRFREQNRGLPSWRER